ncbi:short repeat uncharacterized protein DUF308 [Solirubrobacter pauli]|uniref:Short repeat uncharacterized protein DUF308 n=1 Tax=Solirubrobacter pauli TaxID=166793 RepID=A0A660LAX1_9ACTN|nr:DUF308 domain-containing protein [Solirubrobacter pauli]RKQ92148.1 short repeat uncharacterized protein DUF308 [Solirubrobacter pauli]
MQERTFSLLPVSRAILAILWAAALVVAVGDRIPTTASDVPVAAALLLSAYPLIDAVSSFVERRWINGAISTAASVALAVATFAGDAGAALAVFGAWAVVSGAIQLAVALQRRRSGERQWPMIISGGLSTLAGLSFVAASTQDDAQVAQLGGYAVVGAILYLVWTYRSRHAHAGGDRGRRSGGADARAAA